MPTLSVQGIIRHVIGPVHPVAGSPPLCLQAYFVAIRKFSEETPIMNLYSADTVKNDDGTDNVNNNLYPT